MGTELTSEPAWLTQEGRPCNSPLKVPGNNCKLLAPRLRLSPSVPPTHSLSMRVRPHNGLPIRLLSQSEGPPTSQPVL